MVVVLNASIIQIIADVFNAPIFTQVSEYWPFFQLELLLPTLWHDVFRIRNEFLFAIPSALNSALLFSCSIAQLSSVEPYFQYCSNHQVEENSCRDWFWFLTDEIQ